ncbi:MAG TPA: tetratricopeptide repeat protein [Micromonosporaceae bacterium]|nr:tetratricopeptide repeat protein [Micromonosporaceae bacterium]
MLGPLEAHVNGQVIDLGRPQQRLVLAVLLADAGRLVSTETLIRRVWDNVPLGARRTLHVHITRLRRLLAPVGDTTSGSTRLIRRSGGYLLDVDPDQVDTFRFRRLLAQARHLECPEARRAMLLGQALDLWRGLPLSDLPGQWAARVRQGWQEQYLDTVMMWALAYLRVGDPGTVLPRLCELVGEHPLVESLAAVYMRALYASGRPADALNQYTATRHRLIEELGTDPGPELQHVHRQVLSADPALAPPATISPPESKLVPRQLPAPPRTFTGRLHQLATLDQAHDLSTVVVTAIDGMAGIGKTALAVHAAHRSIDRYPDGQLFIDLHGYTEGREPIQPFDTLDRMLRALGIPGERIPAGLDERAALYRTRLADQRVLIVLDNAATEDQVAPLLPGTAGCLVLVTSRHRLAGLDPTHTLSLESLPTSDAVTLFARTAGESRLANEPPQLLVELVELCGRLPLAIRIAAARLRSHPTWDLSHLVERLRGQRNRLDELQAGQRSVTAALNLSYQHLRPDQQEAYRLLTIHPGPDIDAYSAAALFDVALPHATRMLDQLLDAHLLQEPAPGRYRFHDLTRAHAACVAARDQNEPAGCQALARLLDYYRHTASLAMNKAYPPERNKGPRVPSARTACPDLPAPAAALDWLDTELPNLLTIAEYATEHGKWPHVLHLSTILYEHLRSRGHYHAAETLLRQALTAARAVGDRTAELQALTGLGWAHRRQGQPEQAIKCYGQALQIARCTGHRTGERTALYGLGQVHLWLGRYEQAANHYRQALRIAQVTDDPTGELDALTGLGWVWWRQGQCEQAAEHFGQALRLARDAGDRVGEHTALAGLGEVYLRQGRYEQATNQYQQALQFARAAGDRVGELGALAGLGRIGLRQGRHEQATYHYQQLLDLTQEVGDGNWQVEAWQGLGRLRYAASHPDAALVYHDQALTLARELGQPVDVARAHDGLAHAYHALNNEEEAHCHWQHALNILTDLGIDHTDDEETTTATIRAHMTNLNQQRPSREPIDSGG